ncbi:DUF7927 domain-containing protein [Microbacterium sp. CPCC 204701]|uniref:DUF7927 domain-containing protein n=1 Tax=Microbacterium sp. CPCC 204701 TaxID=2493084 RepID=UPI000FDAA516|nr:DUF11 domain-containing protein [Microbacterium sp. CPCC 204701]
MALTPIDVADGSVITSTQDGTHDNRITYQVQYSCTTDVCNDTQLQFSPSAPDPQGILPADRHLLQWESWVAPVGATISGTDTTGKLASLGNLTPGTSGSFTMTYTVTPDRHRDVPWGSFYPDGFQIEMAATASSPTAVADVTGNSTPVTWNIGLPGGADPTVGPQVGITAPASVSTDVAVDYNLTMNSGVLFYGPGANVTGNAALSAAGSYTVVYQAPPEAVITAAEHGGVIDSAANTVTWTVGSADDPKYAARGGWGLNLTGGFNGGGAGLSNPPGSAMGDDDYALWRHRAVTLEFPGANFPEADADGCNFATTVSSSISVTVTYLDEARTSKTATATRDNQVACWDPFGGINFGKLVYGGAGNQFGQADGSIGGGVFAANVPAAGQPDRTALYWRVEVSNRGNVPGVAVIDEPNLSQPDAPVYQIWSTRVGITAEWVRSDGATGTTTLAPGQVLTAPGTTHFVSARVTTDSIPAGRVQQSDTTATPAYVHYRMRISSTAPIGEQRTNSADITMTYPGYPDDMEIIPFDLEQTAERTIQFTRPSPVIGAAFSGAPVVEGGGPLVPGTEVTYTVGGSTNAIWPGTEVRPQLSFIAPIGWTIVSGSAGIPGAPPGVTYQYATKTIGGVSREVVVATWPGDIAPSTTGLETWPAMTVRATPTAAAPTATGAAVALAWAGDDSGTLSDSITAAFISNTNQFRTISTGVNDASDIDGDGNTTEDFAQSAGSAALTVAAPSAMQVVKELCVPDDSAPGGCVWASDATQPHYVPVTADDITYRITITNGSATALTDVIAYDVLPYEGDTGLLPDSPTRGSQFDLTLAAIESVSPGVTLAYSASTNPTRPEVHPSAPGAVDDWSTDPDGKQALRMAVATLAAGASAQVVFTAAVDGSPVADEQACNSVAVDSAQSLPAEPLAVCVTLAEADLAIELTEWDNLQAGRPSTLGFTVTNLGGSAQAPATVALEIPDGVTVTDLTIDRWNCTVGGGGTAPVSGPVTLSCAPVDDSSQPRTLERDVAEVLSFPVVVEDDSGELCTTGEINGTLFDPDLDNNTISGCEQIAPPPAGLVVTKDDGQTTTQIGAEYTYTITVTNTLLAEAVNGAVVSDTLPASLELVSADGGAVVAGQTLTWSLAGLAPLAEVELHVTVRVLANAAFPIVNEAAVTAPDPGFPGETLTDSAQDSNVVLLLSVAKTSDARPSGAQAGDVITYTVTVTGDDAGDYAGGTITDDLTDVLDEATFVTGSASLSIDGGTAEAVDDPVGNLLTWTGTIPAGADAVLTYHVTVGAPVNGELVNSVSASSDPTDCDIATGLDENGLACAVLTTPFAPTIAKTVESLAQADDGSWTIQYGIDVVNPAPADTVYDLDDALAFGPGITVSSATVTPPAGITAEAWAGSGDVVLAGDLPAGTTHHYSVTVVADAGTAAGTAAASCAPGAALGFANTATLTLSDGAERQAEACAEPVEPAVAKALDGAPVQGADGRWTVTYLITVTNGAERPADGLAYHLQDSLDFPAGLTVDEVQVLPPAGVTANAGFTGGLTEVGGAAVTGDPELVDGAARIPAATGGTATVQEYRVQLIVTSGAGSVDPTLLTCGPAGAGYGNWVALLAGTTELGRATACADIRLPELQFTKIVDTGAGTRSGDSITYTIIAANVGDADFTAGDPAELVDDMTGLLDDARYLENATADSGTVVSVPPALTWTGPLPAGDTVEISYSVLLGDAGTGDGSIVNQVRLAGIGTPTGAIPTCVDTPAGNAGEPACAVTLQLDTRSLAVTGTVLPLLALLAGAVAAVLIGIALMRRRHAEAG